MLIKKKTGLEIPSSEITPRHLYVSRRQFMKGAAAAATGALVTACAGDAADLLTDGERADAPAQPAAEAPQTERAAPDVAVGTADELGDPVNTFEDITNWNNYYEFTIDKQDVARLAADYPVSPWQVEIGGLVNNPGTYDVDDIRRQFISEERIYRLRCVEGWSMVIPWLGFPLSQLLDVVEPQAEATHVRFETILDPENMPGQRSPWYVWPYIEGLRLDEAYNDLAILATGLYGESLLPQNGAPIRLVVPWKYGFKSIKSIVRIDLVDYEPRSLWMAAAPNEYGFYANVNPEVDHPRWSQATERRIGEFGRRPTLMFNGYEEQVAHLYEGQDLRADF